MWWRNIKKITLEVVVVPGAVEVQLQQLLVLELLGLEQQQVERPEHQMVQLEKKLSINLFLFNFFVLRIKLFFLYSKNGFLSQALWIRFISKCHGFITQQKWNCFQKELESLTKWPPSVIAIIISLFCNNNHITRGLCCMFPGIHCNGSQVLATKCHQGSKCNVNLTLELPNQNALFKVKENIEVYYLLFLLMVQLQVLHLSSQYLMVLILLNRRQQTKRVTKLSWHLRHNWRKWRVRYLLV